jgi:endonuclease/exonuclease/phosphatase family metal-dependent hydrolase
VAALRVVTWNIRSAIGPGPFPDRWWNRIDSDRLRAIGDLIAGLDADVIGLQEVTLGSRGADLIDVAGEVARRLGMDARLAAVRTFEAVEDGVVSGAGIFGNALLSREPIRDARTVALPGAPSDAFVEPPRTDHPAAGVRYADAPPTIREPRCIVVASVGDWTIGTTHLSHVGSGERLLQAEAAAAAFGPASPAILVGDLNAAVGSSELAPLADWTDAFAEPPGNPARVSTDDGYAIDHLLARGASVRVPARVVREAGDLSDHYPVVADFG